MYDLSELPAQVHGVLHAEVQALTALGGVNMRGIACQKHASLAIGGRLSRHIREARDMIDAQETKVRSVHGEQRFANLV